MTLVIAQKCGPVTWIGSDTRACTRGGYIYPVPCSKWNRIGDWRVGVTGPGRIQSLMVLHAEALAKAAIEARPEFLADALRKAMLDDKWTFDESRNGGPNMSAAYFLFVSPTLEVYEVAPDGDPTSFGEQFASIGSASERADGVAFALANEHPSTRMLRAIQCAIAQDNNCGGEPYIESLSIKKPVGRCVPCYAGQGGSMDISENGPAWTLASFRQGPVDIADGS
jgi:hypothetical protein